MLSGYFFFLMKKILLVCFLSLLFFGAYYIFSRNRETDISDQSPSGPSFPEEGYFPLGTKEENKVLYGKIRSALKFAPQAGAPGVYAVTVPLEGTPPSVAPEYSIVFFEDRTAFTIVINARPLSETRARAERALLEKLGITEKEACRLNVDLGVIASVDLDMSGRNFGLSFCPNGLPFPEER